MKLIYIITVIIFTSQLLNTYDHTIYVDLKQSSFKETQQLEEIFYQKLEIKTNLPKMLNIFLDRKAEVRQDVPLNIWQNIKLSIDYDFFKTQVISIIPNYYTEIEMQELLVHYHEKPHLPITKIEFRKELSIIVQNFIDNEFYDTANSILSSNGYMPLDN